MAYLTRGGLPIEGSRRAPVVKAGPTAAAGAVDSVFGRIGDVVAKEGDFTIDQMGDVDTTTTPPDARNLLGWDGTNWTPESVLDSGTFP